MRILTYKRTHIGDPDSTGHFGINRCMGRVRDYDYDAVIGVGGTGAEPRQEGIAERINWVGIGPIRHLAPGKKACDVTFRHFVYLEEEGPLLKERAPNLARRLYDRGARVLFDSYSNSELSEAQGILEWSKSQRSSRTAGVKGRRRKADCSISGVPAKPVKKCGC